MAADEITFRRALTGDMVCCFFEVDGKRRHTSAVVINAYDDGNCLLVVPGKDNETLYRLGNMPFSTGPSMPAWHWPRKPMCCPSCEK